MKCLLVADAFSYELTDLPVPCLVKINSTFGETEMKKLVGQQE
jgi:hypothetical protein